MQKDKFIINILLNGVRIPLEIDREEEWIFRDAEKLVNKFFKQYSNTNRSIEEILTIASYHLAVIAILQNGERDISPLAEKIEKLNEELKNELQK
jgi:hypothetical protein